MRTLLLASVAFFAAVTGNAYAEEAKQDFRLVNKTGYELKEVYVAPTSSDSWQEDVLGTGTLADGAAIDIHFHRAEKTCKWDLKVVYTVDDSHATWSDIDLCSTEKITIHYDRAADKTTATFD